MINPSNTLTIKSNETWLQEEPRSTWAIILKLFPRRVDRVRRFPKQRLRLPTFSLGQAMSR